MDSSALVEMQLRDGQKLLEALAQSGFEVALAFWAKASDDDKWYLYIASPAVAKEGVAKTYRRVQPVIRELQKEPFWVDPFEVKAISPQSSIAEGAAKLRGDYPGITRSGWTQLGDVAVEGAYIYSCREACENRVVPRLTH